MNLFKLFLLFFICVRVEATEYEFSTDTFQLGRWSPKSLGYEQGQRKIEALDRWFEGLSEDQKLEFAKIYTLNRNRLFLVTQEKRLKSEVERPIDPIELARDQIQPSWIAAGRNVLRQDKQQMYSNIKSMNETALDDEEALAGRLIGSLSDISKIGLKTPSNADFAPSFSKSLSKSGGPMMGMGSQSMTSGFSIANIDPNKVCRKSDKVCLKKTEALVAEFKRIKDFGRILDGTRTPLVPAPVCQKSEASGPPALGSNGTEAFQKKRTAFLKNVGSQNWTPNKSENDLSQWYSEPISQWSQGRPNAKCVGHAISSDIASVVNKKSLINYSVSPNSTYAQIQVITREDLERKKGNGSITPNEEAILGEFQDVKSIDSKHAEFCNPSFYSVDEYLGAIYVDNSLNHVFKAFQRKPLCGSRDLTSNRDKNGVPLFTVDKFESMEFDKPTEQALNYDFFRQLIDTGNPPIVTIDSDARTESGDWLHIKNEGHLTHALNVVGYGEEIDPVTLCKVRYLKLRDSLGQKKIHYKVPADNFISHVVGIYKVTSVKQTN